MGKKTKQTAQQRGQVSTAKVEARDRLAAQWIRLQESLADADATMGLRFLDYHGVQIRRRKWR